MRCVRITYGQLLVFRCVIFPFSLAAESRYRKNALAFIFAPNDRCIASFELSQVIAVVSETGISWAEPAQNTLALIVKSLLCYDIFKTLIWVVIRCDVKEFVQI